MIWLSLYIRYTFVTHSLQIRLICLCIWTYQNQSTFYIFDTHSSRWARYLDKSKSIITHSLPTCHIGLCIWTNQNQSFITHSLYIRYTFATSVLELDKSKSLINSLHLNLYNIYSLHIRHIGHCIWTNQNQSSHIHYTFATLGSVFG